MELVYELMPLTSTLLKAPRNLRKDKREEITTPRGHTHEYDQGYSFINAEKSSRKDRFYIMV